MDIKELEKYGVDTETVRKCIENYKNCEVTVAVTGEFSSGKSCFINAIMKKKELLPVGDQECTPIYIDLSYGTQERLSVMYKDSYIEHLEFTKEQIEKFARYVPGTNTDALALLAEFPDFPLGNGMHIFDCPGTNTIVPEHEKITELVVQRSDIIVYVINKAIKGDELKRIVSLYDMNEDMIFVLTHMDETNGSHMLPDETINKYIGEARGVLSHSLGIDPIKVKLYPVGSVYSFSDSHLIDDVCQVIFDEVERIRANELRAKAKNKITNYLDNVLYEEKAKLTLMEKLSAEDHSEKQLEADKAKEYLNKIKSSLLDDVNQNKEFVNKRVDALLKRLGDISKSSSDRIITAIKRADKCNLETVQNEFKKELPTYDLNIKNAIRNTIQVISKDEFKNVSDKLNELGEKYICASHNMFEIDPPDFENELTHSDTVDILRKRIENQRNVVKDLSVEREKEIEMIDASKGGLDEDTEKINEKKKALAELGTYRPEYNEEVEEGGGSTGAAIGKVAGLLGDIALLIYSPETASLKAADVAKDLATVAGIAVNTAENILNIIREDDKTKDTKKDSDKNKKDKDSNSALSKTSKALSLVSLSKWGEKAGTAIGEYFRPQVIFKKENLEKREEYYSQKDALVKDIATMEIRLKNEKDKLDQLSSSSVILEKLNEAKRTLEELEKLDRDEQRIEKKRMADEKERLTVEYYYNCVAAEFLELADRNIKNVTELMEQVKQLIGDTVMEAANNRINELQESIDKMTGEEAAAKKELENCQKRLNEINSIRNSVDQWLSENAK
ncbi:dynamin family protein [uncultured Ruminococcus sp.]|uniref:dynamin family protein n=1 Tax=uncultured Ruminococcus sp. TaxID=165186 RepID=UPI0025E3207B|nr:dynamin family protein [uncultured Ruminococcus sp.]